MDRLSGRWHHLGFAAAALLAALVSAAMTVLIATQQARTFGAGIPSRYWSVHLASALVLVTALIALAARLMLQPALETDAERGWLILGYVIIAAALFVAPGVMVLWLLSARRDFGIAVAVGAGLLALAAVVSWRQLRAQPRAGRLRLASLIAPTQLAGARGCRSNPLGCGWLSRARVHDLRGRPGPADIGLAIVVAGAART